MPSSNRCPFCDARVHPTDLECPSCGETLDEAETDRADYGALERMVVPLGRPISAIAAGYCGLIGLFPFCGIPFAIAAIPCGIYAIRAINRDAKLSGLGRAWFGIAAGAIMLLLQATLIPLFALGIIR